ncbi:UBA-like domain-containing protein 1 [Arapaima gigas]
MMCTPANTPATPPNFPDALTMFSRLKASESFGGGSGSASVAVATSPPPQVSWAVSSPGPTQQGLWTHAQPPLPMAPAGWPIAVTQQASSEQKAGVAVEAER